eukprot:TRINITY_DN5142_c0_g1_i1.p1 TRINITY_DN5142_c0_g1~~TRINITY_DN5142_c0_g1_i1.p1  ORF type:complete len:626 (+),score=123.73 TRINITY_DN5142_c0_g1_i1:133-1878(+)
MEVTMRSFQAKTKMKEASLRVAEGNSLPQRALLNRGLLNAEARSQHHDRGLYSAVMSKLPFVGDESEDSADDVMHEFLIDTDPWDSSGVSSRGGGTYRECVDRSPDLGVIDTQARSGYQRHGFSPAVPRTLHGEPSQSPRSQFYEDFDWQKLSLSDVSAREALAMTLRCQIAEHSARMELLKVQQHEELLRRREEELALKEKTIERRIELFETQLEKEGRLRSERHLMSEAKQEETRALHELQLAEKDTQETSFTSQQPDNLVHGAPRDVRQPVATVASSHGAPRDVWQPVSTAAASHGAPRDIRQPVATAAESHDAPRDVRQPVATVAASHFAPRDVKQPVATVAASSSAHVSPSLPAPSPHSSTSRAAVPQDTPPAQPAQQLSDNRAKPAVEQPVVPSSQPGGQPVAKVTASSSAHVSTTSPVPSPTPSTSRAAVTQDASPAQPAQQVSNDRAAPLLEQSVAPSSRNQPGPASKQIQGDVNGSSGNVAKSNDEYDEDEAEELFDAAEWEAWFQDEVSNEDMELVRRVIASAEPDEESSSHKNHFSPASIRAALRAVALEQPSLKRKLKEWDSWVKATFE